MYRKRFRCFVAQAVLMVAWQSVHPSQAQETLRIAAIVNEDVISVHDLSERIKIVLLASGLADSPEQRQQLAPRVLDSLVNETLQIQAAKQSNISVSDRDIDTAFRELEDRNGIPEGQLPAFLREKRIHPSAMEKQVRARLAWQKLLNRQIAPTVNIGQEEIDFVVERIAAVQGVTLYRVSEIVLALERPTDEAQILELAQRLIEQIRGGASFAAVAQQFSQGASAAVGGDLGWVQPGQLNPDVDIALVKSQPGELFGPVTRPHSVRIYQFADRRRADAAGGNELEVSLRQLLLPLSEDAPRSEIDAAIVRVREAAGAVKDCVEFASVAEELGTPQPDAPSRIRVGDLSPELQRAIGVLGVNQASEPLDTPYGVQLVMVCERHDQEGGPDRDGIAEQLFYERIDMLARRKIRDLRRAAFIDVRI